ncbi:hypothetical protein WJX72_000436 [[Myrmecia] bisecta]|uniref:Uncharacterized protein n=1 Tax=[Myrmecia] bisecta TaxID=41462 RepID=A0AAW1Q9T0_9CHLO
MCHRLAVLEQAPLPLRCHSSSIHQTGAEAEQPDGDVLFCFGLDGVVCDLCGAITQIAWRAASQLWPRSAPGSAAVYERKMREVWPAVCHPHESVMLLRLLAEEGVIGGRSTAGRQGPVVGRSPRAQGTRGLLAAEIVEHWAFLKDACLRRWGVEDERVIQQAFLDQMADCARGDAATPWRPHIRPHQAVVEAINGSSRPVLVASPLPLAAISAVLEHCSIDPGAAAAVSLPANGRLAAHLCESAPAACATVHVMQDRLSPLEHIQLGWPQNGPQLCLHLADWGHSTPAMRARAVAVPGVDVLSDVRLAELMNVTHLTAVMDGVAWR